MVFCGSNCNSFSQVHIFLFYGFLIYSIFKFGFIIQWALVVKKKNKKTKKTTTNNLPANAGAVRDVSSFPGLGRSSGEGNVNPL